MYINATSTDAIQAEARSSGSNTAPRSIMTTPSATVIELTVSFFVLFISQTRYQIPAHALTHTVEAP